MRYTGYYTIVVSFFTSQACANCHELLVLRLLYVFHICLLVVCLSVLLRRKVSSACDSVYYGICSLSS